MNLSWSTIFGVIFGFGLFVYAVFASTDHWVIFMSLSSLSLVVGGTIGATFIAYQGVYVFRTLKALGGTLFDGGASASEITGDIKVIVLWAEEAQKKGVAILDDKFEAGEFDRMGDFGGWAYQLLSSGYKGEELRDMLEDYVQNEYFRNNVQVGILKTMASFAPAFGMVGTLIGLIIMLDQLDGDPAALGQGLALALITTLYGVVFANLVFKPAAMKTEQKNQIIKFRHLLCIEGFVSLSNRVDAVKIQDQLNAKLSMKIQVDVFSTDTQGK